MPQWCCIQRKSRAKGGDSAAARATARATAREDEAGDTSVTPTPAPEAIVRRVERERLRTKSRSRTLEDDDEAKAKAAAAISQLSTSDTLSEALTCIDECFEPFWAIHPFYSRIGIAIAAIHKESKMVAQMLDDVLFEHAGGVVVHSTVDDGLRLNPTERDYRPTGPGQIRCDIRAMAIDKKDLPKGTWSLLGASGGNKLDVHLELPSERDFLSLFTQLFLDIHALPIGTWILESFPELSKIVFLQGSVEKVRRKQDNNIDVLVDCDWHPKLKEKYFAVYNLIAHLELLQITISSEKKHFITKLEVTQRRLFFRYVCSADGYVVSYENADFDKSPTILYFDPKEHIAFHFEMAPRIKLTELGCGSMKMAVTHGKIIFSGANIIGGHDGEFKVVARVTDVGHFPFESMLRPFFDCDQLRQIVKTHFIYQLAQKQHDNGTFTLDLKLIFPVPKMGRMLVSCLRSFAKHQMEHMDALKLIGDVFTAMGSDMKVQYDKMMRSPRRRGTVSIECDGLSEPSIPNSPVANPPRESSSRFYMPPSVPLPALIVA